MKIPENAVKIDLFDAMDLGGGSIPVNDTLKYINLITQIKSILSSYDDPLDAFTEMVQNSLDSVEQAYRSRNNYIPKIKIIVDTHNNSVSVIDNGVGVRRDDFSHLIRPNLSLKKLLGEKNTRGEKGAALAFLQFGHHYFEFQSKVEDEDGWTYELYDGVKWFKETTQALETSATELLPGNPYKIKDGTNLLDNASSGVAVTIKFGEGSTLDNLADLLSSDPQKVAKRLEHILRTRTGIGYFLNSDIKDRYPEYIRKLETMICVLSDSGDQSEYSIVSGFQFPHLLAADRGRKTSRLTQPKLNTQLAYDFFDVAFIEERLPKISSNRKFMHIARKYDVQGYVSYAYNNTFYEDTLYPDILGVDSEDSETLYQIVQVNGGFQLCVKSFPTGKRHAFMQRSGAEDKSRTYIVINFNGDYTPDYGRKNVAAEVKQFVTELCRELITFATTREAKTFYVRSKANSTHQITNLTEAEEKRSQEVAEAAKLKPWIMRNSMAGKILRKPESENEVIAEFVHYVLNGTLPGYTLYGAYPTYLNDMMFDFHLDEANYYFNKQSRILGTRNTEQSKRGYKSKWIEFKKTSDMLVTDLSAAPGSPGKKWFSLIDLLVCDKVDISSENYKIIPVSEDDELLDSRTYYGVTHIMTSETNDTRVIQVIELSTIRSILNGRSI